MRSMAQLAVAEKSVRMTATFRGYNHREVISDGEMFDTINLGDEMYPVLSVRKKRGITHWDGEDKLTGILGRDKLVYVRGSDVYYNFEKVDGISVSTAENMCPKKIVSMGAYCCIWPDKKYFNTVDLMDCGSMERTWDEQGVQVSLMMCRGDGTDYDMNAIAVGITPPENPENGDLWIDQSGSADVLRQYYSPTQEWIEVASTYVKIASVGIGIGLKEYDAVMISGLEAGDPGESQRIKDEIATLNGSYTIFAAGEDYIVVAGLISKTMQIGSLKDNTVRVDRTVPDLDFIVESNNRLWGCRYGMADGQVVNEIRASKLGDFRNWSCFMGVSTDSYTVSIGTDGPWTGAVSQRGYPVFFKENCIHKVSGMTPSTYQVSTTVCRGVQRDSGRSVCVVNETVYYKSRKDIMAYDGNMPVSVGEQLGNIPYSDARAGAKGEKYYISMKDANGQFSLFTFNTNTGIWYKEDHTKALGFGQVEDELYFIDEENNTLVAVDGSQAAEEGAAWALEEDPEWMAEFGISGVEISDGYRADINGSHYLSRFDIRMYMEKATKVELEIMYDSDGIWRKQGETIQGTRMKTRVIPVVPRRCDHLRFRIKGKGEIRIYSIARNMEVGSDA